MKSVLGTVVHDARRGTFALPAYGPIVIRPTIHAFGLERRGTMRRSTDEAMWQTT
jgi:hypothetical protein